MSFTASCREWLAARFPRLHKHGGGLAAAQATAVNLPRSWSAQTENFLLLLSLLVGALLAVLLWHSAQTPMSAALAATASAAPSPRPLEPPWSDAKLNEPIALCPTLAPAPAAAAPVSCAAAQSDVAKRVAPTVPVAVIRHAPLLTSAPPSETATAAADSADDMAAVAEGADGADRAASQSEHAESDNAAQLFSRANALAEREQWQQAEALYFQAVRLAPSEGDYLFNLAVSLDHLQETAGAVHYYRAALQAARRPSVLFDRKLANARVNELSRELTLNRAFTSSSPSSSPSPSPLPSTAVNMEAP